jgi:hypothetical protein
MDREQNLKWKPSMLTLEQVQAVLTHHREININFVINVFTLCLGKKQRKVKTSSLASLQQDLRKVEELHPGL